MRHFRTTALLALAAAAFAGTARADDAGAVAAGQGIAKTWCVNCHVIAPGQARGSDQTPSFTSIAARPDTTADKLRAFLAQPHGMPDFKLSRTDIDNMVAYILSLRH